MPYNTTAIPPRKEPTGQTQLPLSRVRKIVALDPDVAICSSNAAFVITLATELFIQYLSSEAENMVKLDRKPRRNIQYRDLASAVSRVDRLEFLEDTVPVTVPYGKIKGDAAVAQAKLRNSGSGAAGSASGSGGGSGGRSGGGGSGRASKGGSRASAGGGGSGTTAPLPTAISALMLNGAADTADTPAAASTNEKRRRRVLPFSILNGTDDDDDDGDAHNTSRLSFRSARTDGGDVSSGVAAAAALAQAAAASGTSSALALDDAGGPDEQLEQDMRRVHSGTDEGRSSGGGRSSRNRDSGRYSNGDVDMRDS